MALRIQPVAVPRPLFRRLVREEHSATMKADFVFNQGEGERIHLPENFRYPHALMNIEDMMVLLETAIVPATSDAHYDDAQPAIDQYAFEFVGPAPAQNGGGAVVSQQI